MKTLSDIPAPRPLPAAKSQLTWSDAVVIKSLVDNLREAEDHLHRARTALDRALAGLIADAKQLG